MVFCYLLASYAASLPIERHVTSWAVLWKRYVGNISLSCAGAETKRHAC